MTGESTSATDGDRLAWSLPFEHLLAHQSSILIVGMGGGFDVFCGLPIYFELRRRGHTVHLASVSFASLADYVDGEWLSDSLVGVGPALDGATGYHPERFLSRFFCDRHHEDVGIWCFEPQGVQPMLQGLRLLARRFNLDAVILVDGGVDSLTRGDEELVGTVLEDYVSLAAAAILTDVPIRLIACPAMGVEGDVCHAQVLENIASITAGGGLLGVSTLLGATQAYRDYEEAISFVHGQPGQQPSVVNACLISSVRGHFGDYHLTERTRDGEMRITPLMSLYWFLDVAHVAANNLFVRDLAETRTAGDAFGVIYEARDRMALRPATPVSLP